MAECLELVKKKVPKKTWPIIRRKIVLRNKEEKEGAMVLTGQDDVIKVILRRKDSDPDELCVSLTPTLKKNSFIKINIEEEEPFEEDTEKNVNEIQNCSLCMAVMTGDAKGTEDAADKENEKGEITKSRCVENIR